MFIEKSIFETGRLESFGQLRINRMTEKYGAKLTVIVIKKACSWCILQESIERMIQAMAVDTPLRASLIKP